MDGMGRGEMRERRREEGCLRPSAADAGSRGEVAAGGGRYLDARALRMEIVTRDGGVGSYSRVLYRQ